MPEAVDTRAASRRTVLSRAAAAAPARLWDVIRDCDEMAVNGPERLRDAMQAALAPVRSLEGAMFLAALAVTEADTLESFARADRQREAGEAAERIEALLRSVILALELATGVRREEVGASAYAPRRFDAGREAAHA